MVRSVSGAIIDIDTRDYAGVMMFHARYANALLALIRACVKRGDTVLDVGAQLGYVTHHLARAVGPEGTVHSFEPDPNAFERLEALVRRNDLAQVVAHPRAASNRDGALPFNVSATLGWSTAAQNTHLTDLSATTVQCVRVDALREAGAVAAPVRFVKIDVEGHECEALEGMERVLREDRPLVVAELNPTMLRAAGHSPGELLQRLSAHGHQLYRLASLGGPFGRVRAGLEALRDSDATSFGDVVAVPPGHPLLGKLKRPVS